MIKKLKIFIVFFLFLSGVSSAQEINPTEIIRRADDLLQGQSSSGTYRMTVKTPSWERKLELIVSAKNKEKTFIRIISPAKEAGIGTLRVKNEMWNYLPNVERTIKIPPSMMLQPWMGSEFANDDLVKESSIVNDYTHRLLAEESLDGKTVYKIELIPKPEAAVIWGKIFMWVGTDPEVPLREEYYDERGKLIKILHFSDIGKVSDRIMPRIWRMESKVKPGHETTIELWDVQYNIPIDDNIFSLNNLKKLQ